MRPLILAIAVVVGLLVPAPQTPCSGPNDDRPGCPHDPAGWICTHEGKGKTHACACQTVCSLDEDGAPHMSESSNCKRYCKLDRCDCNPEAECPK